MNGDTVVECWIWWPTSPVWMLESDWPEEDYCNRLASSLLIVFLALVVAEYK
jgi:hypothetical protein